MHEILTVQLGQKSNYLATHFWNTQESYFTYSADEESLVDHDIHFRAGLGADGSETFTPRTVIYDLKGGFGSMRKINALYEIEEETSTPQGAWNGQVVVQRQRAIEQHAYQQSLDQGLVPPRLTSDSVRYWSDFSRVFYHPKSIVQLNDYELNSSLMPFENWSVGEDLFNSLDKEHDLLDRDLRPFAEEADHMQGIQLLSTLDDAWGGFAAKYMDRLRDEYGKTTIWLWGLEDGLRNVPREKQLLRLSNTAHSLAETSPQASLFVPMALPSATLPPYVNIDRQSSWHVSALFSTALESMTLPSRLKVQDRQRESLDEITGALNVNGNQNIARIAMSIGQKSQPNGDHHPGPSGTRGEVRENGTLSHNGGQDELEAETEDVQPLDMDFFPSDEVTQPLVRPLTRKRVHVFGQADAERGDDHVPGHEVNQDDFDGRDRARRRAAGLPIIHRTWSPVAFPLLDSFPRIYSHTPSSTSSESVAVHTSLSTDSTVAFRIKSIRNFVTRAIGIDERENLTNTLGALAEAYEEGWDSGSDEDDD